MNDFLHPLFNIFKTYFSHQDFFNVDEKSISKDKPSFRSHDGWRT